MDRSFGRTWVRVAACAAWLIGALGSVASQAVPVRLHVNPGAGLRDLSAACETKGCAEQPVIGSLEAERRGRLLSGIRGTLELGDGEEMVVVGGEIDFRRPFPDRAVGRFVTSTHGEFLFVYHHAGPNAFDGGVLDLLGANGRTVPVSRGKQRVDAAFLLSLRARVRPVPKATKVPEPVGIVALGLLLATWHRRRSTGDESPV